MGGRTVTAGGPRRASKRGVIEMGGGVSVIEPSLVVDYAAVRPPAERGAFESTQLVVFCVLAYGISWAWVIPWAVTGHTVLQGDGRPPHFPSLLGPMLAAFAVTVGPVADPGSVTFSLGWAGGGSGGVGRWRC